jgi:5-formyltetrahydrofolate cyclo-ligase
MGADERGVAHGKAALRAELLAARRTRSEQDLARARAAVCKQVFAHLAAVERVAAYEPMRTEPGSTELLAGLHARQITVLVPLTLPDRDLDWTQWSPDGPGAPLGVDAIGSVDLVLAPALAVARDGTRLGRGGGSYDRALARCAAGTMLAAVVFDDEVLDEIPHDEWDVPVHAAVAPSGWLDLAGNTEMRFRR